MAQIVAAAALAFVASRVARDLAKKRKQDDILDEVRWTGAAEMQLGIAIWARHALVSSLQYRGTLVVPLERALEVRDAMIKQMETGLAEHNSKEGLLMLPSYIDILPTGLVAGRQIAAAAGRADRLAD